MNMMKNLASCDAYNDCIDLVIQLVDEGRDKDVIAKMMNYYNVVTRVEGSSKFREDYQAHQDKKWNCVYELLLREYVEKRKYFFESRCELSDC